MKGNDLRNWSCWDKHNPHHRVSSNYLSLITHSLRAGKPPDKKMKGGGGGVVKTPEPLSKKARLTAEITTE